MPTLLLSQSQQSIGSLSPEMEWLRSLWKNYRHLSICVVIIISLILTNLFLIVYYKSIFIDLESVLQHDRVDGKRMVYAFNFTNSEEFLMANETPSFSEVGPFVFKENYKMERRNDENLTFERISRWSFVAEESEDYNVNVTNFSPDTATMMYAVKNTVDPFIVVLAQLYLRKYGDEPFLTLPANEHQAHHAEKFTVKFAEKKIGEHFTTTFENWFPSENKTSYGIFEYDSYGYLTAWAESQCRVKVNLDRPDYSVATYEFIPEVHRSLILEKKSCKEGKCLYLGTDEYWQGNEFHATVCRSRTLHGVRKKGSCLSGKDWQCEETPFSMLAVLSLSLPHFLDREGTTNLEGINPHYGHYPYIVRDELTHLELERNLTYQVNLKVTSVTSTETPLDGKPEMEIPLVWYRETAKASEIVHKKIGSEKKRYMALVAIWLFTGMILLVLLLSLLAYVHSKRNLTPEWLIQRDNN